MTCKNIPVKGLRRKWWFLSAILLVMIVTTGYATEAALPDWFGPVSRDVAENGYRVNSSTTLFMPDNTKYALALISPDPTSDAAKRFSAGGLEYQENHPGYLALYRSDELGEPEEITRTYLPQNILHWISEIKFVTQISERSWLTAIKTGTGGNCWGCAGILPYVIRANGIEPAISTDMYDYQKANHFFRDSYPYIPGANSRAQNTGPPELIVPRYGSWEGFPVAIDPEEKVSQVTQGWLSQRFDGVWRWNPEDRLYKLASEQMDPRPAAVVNEFLQYLSSGEVMKASKLIDSSHQTPEEVLFTWNRNALGLIHSDDVKMYFVGNSYNTTLPRGWAPNFGALPSQPKEVIVAFVPRGSAPPSLINGRVPLARFRLEEDGEVFKIKGVDWWFPGVEWKPSAKQGLRNLRVVIHSLTLVRKDTLIGDGVRNHIHEGIKTLAVVDITIENGRDSILAFYPEQANLLIGNEEIEALPNLSDAIGTSHWLPAEHRSGRLVFPLESPLSELLADQSAVLFLGGPTNLGRLGGGLSMPLTVSLDMDPSKALPLARYGSLPSVSWTSVLDGEKSAVQSLMPRDWPGVMAVFAKFKPYRVNGAMRETQSAVDEQRLTHALESLLDGARDVPTLGKTALESAAAKIDRQRRALVEQWKDFRNRSSARRLNAEALKLLRRDDMEQAAVRWRHAVRYDPLDEEIVNNFGYVLWRQGRLEEAAAWYLWALMLNPRREEAWAGLGQILADFDETLSAQNAYTNYLIFSDSAEQAVGVLQSLKKRTDSISQKEIIENTLSKAKAWAPRVSPKLAQALGVQSPSKVSENTVEVEHYATGGFSDRFAVSESRSYFDDDGNLHIVAVYQNVGDLPFERLRATVEFMTDTGISLKRQSVYVYPGLTVFPKSQFAIDMDFEVDDADERTVSFTKRAKITWSASNAEATAKPHMMIHSLKIEKGYYDDRVRIRGMIKNTSDHDFYREARFQLIFYDEHGRVITWANTQPLSATLVPGAEREWTTMTDFPVDGLTPSQLSTKRMTVTGNVAIRN